MRSKGLSILAVLIGAAMLCYPWISDLLYDSEVREAYVDYQEQISSMEDQKKTALLARAREYNRLLASGRVVSISGDQMDYESQLCCDDQGTMGYLRIPKIQVDLPISHGTGQQALEQGAGHMEGTSLPIGGESTHCVLTGHTGLNKARLFTDLQDLEQGDRFYLEVCGEELCYEVCDIQVVDPSDVSQLKIEAGRDLCTLVTCTPYGVNNKRLLVTGERVSQELRTDTETEVSGSVSTWKREYFKALLGAALLFGVGLLVLQSGFRRKRHEKDPG